MRLLFGEAISEEGKPRTLFVLDVFSDCIFNLVHKLQVDDQIVHFN